MTRQLKNTTAARTELAGLLSPLLTRPLKKSLHTSQLAFRSWDARLTSLSIVLLENAH